MRPKQIPENPLVRCLLLPFSWLYGFGIAIRNRAFDVGILRATSVGVPVISVGNLTAGGTGKTPLVEAIVRRALAVGKTPAIVSRGYGRESKGVVVVSDGETLFVDATQGGDEPVQMAKKMSDAIVVVGEKRVEAALTAIKLGSDLIVVDDGFQHRYIKRDLDIVVVDAQKDVRFERMLPAGFRRELVQSLKRADLIAFSGIEDQATFDRRTNELRKYNVGTFIGFRYEIDKLVNFESGQSVELGTVSDVPCLAFSGIGNHEKFIATLNQAGLSIVGDMEFPDHHRYSFSDCNRLIKIMGDVDATSLLTTEKDASRIMSDRSVFENLLESKSVFYTVVSVHLTFGESEFESTVSVIFSKSSTNRQLDHSINQKTHLSKGLIL